MAKKAYDITVVGPGAIGCLFGAMLGEAGHRVTMLDIHAERAEKIHRDGIHVRGVSNERSVSVRATAHPPDVADTELVIIATKSYDTAEAVGSIADVVETSAPVLTLQNGLGNVEVISRAVGEERAVGGITAQGATLVRAGSIIHAGTGKTVIGTPSNKRTGSVERVREVLESAGFKPQVSDNLEATIWSKLIINVGINALTAITRLNNGRLLEFEGTRRVMGNVVTEAAAVAAARGIRIPHDDPLAQVEEVCRLTAANVSSMLQDVLARRRTEIDAINGAVAHIGQELRIATPVNAALTLLVRTIEASYDLQVGD